MPTTHNFFFDADADINRFKWPYSWPSSKNLQSKQVGIKYRKIRTPAGTASPNFSGIRAARPVALGKV